MYIWVFIEPDLSLFHTLLSLSLSATHSLSFTYHFFLSFCFSLIVNLSPCSRQFYSVCVCVGGSLRCALALEVFRDSCGLEERSLCFSDLSGRKTDTGKIENDDMRERVRHAGGRAKEGDIWRLGEGRWEMDGYSVNDSEKTREDESVLKTRWQCETVRERRGASKREERRHRREAPPRWLRRIPHCPSLWWRSRQGARGMVRRGVKLTWRWPWHKGAAEEGARRCVAGLPGYGHSGLACCFCVCASRLTSSNTHGGKERERWHASVYSHTFRHALYVSPPGVFRIKVSSDGIPNAVRMISLVRVRLRPPNLSHLSLANEKPVLP